MTVHSTAPILVIGLGCRQGCSTQELLTLIEQSLGRAGIALSAVSALASIDRKRLEPGLLQLAAQLNLGFEVFSAQQLAPYAPELSHRSSLAFEQTGCFGIAESAALALAEQLGGAAASLVITRQKSPGATFALASIEQNPR
ncbi:cobalamin biosynthesis protein [Pseudomonas kulmbachensis]|uniref:cobalamin biosynthesis protein n=1 Tax=Pseudomonas kulmbachensis TaxID=3043408 RepID=UPI002AB034B2|nr:cobalamin biosynthesis protein [Pseudomonas sp. V3/3/4/13]